MYPYMILANKHKINTRLYKYLKYFLNNKPYYDIFEFIIESRVKTSSFWKS